MKALLFLFIAAACIFPVKADENISHAGKNTINAGNIAMIIAPDNFRDEELRVPLSAFKKAGFKVTVFSKTIKQSKGMLGYKFTPDKKLSELNVKNFQAIIFVGGSGAKNYWDNKLCHQICKSAVKQNKLLAAICIAPVILSRAGILKGKKATVWPNVSKELSLHGAKFTGADVTEDDEIITANGPKASVKFAEAIISKLKSLK